MVNDKREVLGTSNNIVLVFNGTDQDDHDALRIFHTDVKTAPFGYKYEDGVFASVSGTRTSGNMPTLTSSDTLWVRVTCNGTSVTVKCATSEAGLSTASNCFSSSNFTISGGMIGFRPDDGDGGSVDDLTIKADRDSNGSYETTEHYDAFAANGSGQGEETPTYDAAGNLTYDGVQKYSYDAWNRLVKVTKAYRNSGGTLTDGSVISESNASSGTRDCITMKNQTLCIIEPGTSAPPSAGSCNGTRWGTWMGWGCMSTSDQRLSAQLIQMAFKGKSHLCQETGCGSLIPGTLVGVDGGIGERGAQFHGIHRTCTGIWTMVRGIGSD